VVSVDGNCLRRTALLRAVAVAAGRQSPDVFRDDNPEDLIGERIDPPTIAEARASGRLILIAEDDDVNQKVILRQIEMLGYAAEIAHDGAEALRLWEAGDYALLLTDLHMPVMDGYSLAAAIRKHEADHDAHGPRRIPILALTANALRGEAIRAQAAGMDEYLTKPLQLHLLQVALARWLPLRGIEAAVEDAADSVVPQHASSAIDISVLERLVGNDVDTVRELLDAYLASAHRQATELRAADAVDDLRQIGEIAHRLKSSSRAVGAATLGDLCAELENACRTGAREAVTQGLDAFDAALRAIDAQLAGPTPVNETVETP
jgi:CheY-like chemotaxis protein/HPt (histidine-containing phosphotransfer) domain-containing protein